MSKKINLIIFYSLVLFSIYCAIRIGIPWDEPNIIQFGEERLKYIFSLGSNKDFQNQWEGSRFYPGTYSVIAVFVTKMFPIKYQFEIIHLVNLVFGISTIIGISKISKDFFNKKVGKIVFLVCFFTPQFFGHMVMNERDLIIAFCNVWSVYLFIKYLKNQNIDKKRNKYVLLTGLIFGLGLGVRFAFLATLIPIIIFLMYDILFIKKIIKNDFSFKKLIFDVLKIIFLAYFLMVLFWPHVHENIFVLPFKFIIESFSSSQIGVALGLLDGEFYLAKDPPKSYMLVSLISKLPEFILLSYLLLILLLIKDNKFFNSKFNFFYYKISFVLIIIFLPNLFLFINPYGLYDGLRQFLYIIPYTGIIPALVIYYLFYGDKNIFNKILSIFLLSFILYHLLNFISLTPYQYTYVNSFKGKFVNVDKKFENDYWGISLKELINRIPNNDELSNKKNIKLASCGVNDSIVEYYLKDVKGIKFDFVKRHEKYDYIIMTNRVVWDLEGIQNLENAKTCYEKFTGENVLTVTRKGLVLSTIRRKF